MKRTMRPLMATPDWSSKSQELFPFITLVSPPARPDPTWGREGGRERNDEEDSLEKGLRCSGSPFASHTHTHTHTPVKFHYRPDLGAKLLWNEGISLCPCELRFNDQKCKSIIAARLETLLSSKIRSPFSRKNCISMGMAWFNNAFLCWNSVAKNTNLTGHK